MNKKVYIKIFDIIGQILASCEDGNIVYDNIVENFKNNNRVEVSFSNCKICSSIFLAVAIGELYNGEYPDSFLEKNLRIVDISEQDRETVNRAIDNAKRYFANRSQYDNAWEEEIGYE